MQSVAAKFQWTTDSISRLMDEYQRHECLYAVSSPSYFNKDGRQTAWESIATNVGVLALEAQKKMGQLRNNYVRVKRRNGSHPQPWYTSRLAFLDAHLKIRVSSNTTTEVTDDDSESDFKVVLATSEADPPGPTSNQSSPSHSSMHDSTLPVTSLQASSHLSMPPASTHDPDITASTHGPDITASTHGPDITASSGKKRSLDTAMNERGLAVKKSKPLQSGQDKTEASSVLAHNVSEFVGLGPSVVPQQCSVPQGTQTADDPLDAFGKYIVAEMRQCKNTSAVFRCKAEMFMCIQRMQTAHAESTLN